jgi:hypothetical protein
MVTDAPIANAIVTASVNDQTFTTNADANGNYTLEITLPQSAANAFVTLSAKGVGSQSYVEFTSLLGTFSSLLTQAGSDATLSSAENFATQITNLSTALAVLLTEANNGQPVTSETLIATLSATLNSQDVLDVATAIKLLIDEDYPMPAGQSSLSALLSNTDAREAYIDAAYLLDRATFVATQTAIVSDATLVKPITPATVPVNLIATTLPTDLPNTYAGVDRSIAYTFNADGTGTATTSYWHRSTTWSVTNGSIEILFAPVAMWGIERGVCPAVPDFGYGVQEISVDYTIRGATLRQLSDRMLAVTEDRDITYRQLGCGASGVTETVTVVRTILDSSHTLSVDAADLGDSTRTLWVYDARSDFENETTTLKVLPDIADLRADGTGTTRVFNQQFSWVVDADSKVVTATFSDGTVAKYRWLRDVERVASDVFYDLALPTGERNVGAGVSIHADPRYPLVFTPEGVLGRHYWLGIGDVGSPPQFKGFRYRLDADGTGSHEDEIVDEFGNISVLDATQASGFGLNWSLFWHISGETMVQQRTRRGPGEFNCSLIEPGCVVSSERRHFPLARDGARTYSLVLFRSDSNGVNDLSHRQTYIGMYDYEPFGASAPNNKPTLAGK